MARSHLIRWWLFGAAIWLAEVVEFPWALRVALWLSGPAHGERRW